MTTNATCEPDAQRIDADIAALATLTNPDREGWTRQVFTDPYRTSRDWVERTMRDAGLDVRRDGVGNLIGVLAGSAPSAPPIVTGSHTDTVSGGGRFDGVVGVLGAIELARCIRESGTPLTHDLVVVDFLGEETNDWGMTCLGSRSITGALAAEDLGRTNHEGVTLAEQFTRFGVEPDGVLRERWIQRQRPHAYLELHIEQGPLLERAGTSIGVVTAIAGIRRLVANFLGRADHAGTRPMDDRRDAMIAAAHAVLEVQQIACGAPIHGVATTASIRNASPSLNVVPADVELRTEVRSVDQKWFGLAQQQLMDRIAARARESGVEVEFAWSMDNEIVETTASMQDTIARSADHLGYSWSAVPSGASHDAAHIARECPTGMIFIPSKDGRSHCPEEWSEIDDIAAGVRVLGDAVRRIDTASVIAS